MLDPMPEQASFWRSATSRVTPGEIQVRGYETRERPYRDVGWEKVQCDGPDPRPLP